MLYISWEWGRHPANTAADVSSHTSSGLGLKAAFQNDPTLETVKSQFPSPAATLYFWRTSCSPCFFFGASTGMLVCSSFCTSSSTLSSVHTSGGLLATCRALKTACELSGLPLVSEATKSHWSCCLCMHVALLSLFYLLRESDDSNPDVAAWLLSEYI